MGNPSINSINSIWLCGILSMCLYQYENIAVDMRFACLFFFYSLVKDNSGKLWHTVSSGDIITSPGDMPNTSFLTCIPLRYGHGRGTSQQTFSFPRWPWSNTLSCVGTLVPPKICHRRGLQAPEEAGAPHIQKGWAQKSLGGFSFNKELVLEQFWTFRGSTALNSVLFTSTVA